MDDLLNNENEIKSIKTRIVTEFPNINKIINKLLNQIDLTLFDNFDEFKRNIQSELKLANTTNSDSATASIEEIDVFFRSFNYDSVQPVMDKPISGRGRKLARAQSVHPNLSKPLSDSRQVSGSLASLTPTTSMSGTTSQQNLNSLSYDADYKEIDRTALKKIAQIRLNNQFVEDISTNYDLELEQFHESCKRLDLFLTQLKMPKEENIKTLTVNPEANRLAIELKKAIKNLISILQIDLNQANNIFDCDGEPFPLYEVLTELYQVL